VNPTIVRSVSLFVCAGLLEIGGGYLVWQWMRQGHSPVRGVVGMVLLALYGVLATWQPAGFSRVYAAYGGIFIALSLGWGWALDGHRPDTPEVAGALLCLAGAAVIMYWPRG
jgi:small multidrug resistance family-3 protein